MRLLSRSWEAIKSPASMAILAIVGFGFAIYTAFFYEKRGELRVSIDALTRVFDVYQPVGGLEISYAGENLRSAKKALWAASFTISNPGNAEIKKGDFDDQVPFGVLVEGADIVETPTIKTSVEYLSRNLKTTTKKDSISLSPIILEPGDEIQVGMMLLGSESARPTLKAIGKVAGIKTISIRSIEQKEADKGTWKTAIEGGETLVHIVRFLLYGAGGLFVITLIFAMGFWLSSPFRALKDKIERDKRRDKVISYQTSESNSKIDQALLQIYIDKGENALQETSFILKRAHKRNALGALLVENVPKEELGHVVRQSFPLWKTDIMGFLEERKLITVSNGLVEIADGLESSLQSLAEHLALDLNIEGSQTPGLVRYDLELGFPSSFKPS